MNPVSQCRMFCGFRQRTLFLSVAFLLVFSPCLAAAEYMYLEFSSPGYAQTVANGVNSHGHVAGWVSNGENTERAFLYDGKVFQLLLPPGWVRAWGRALNDNGEVVGYGYDGSGQVKGFLYKSKNRRYTELASPFGPMTEAAGINNSGVIVGTSWDEAGSAKGYIYDGNSYVMLLPPGCSYSYTTSINDNGVVGLESGAPYIYSGGVYTKLLPPGWTCGGVPTVNAAGDVLMQVCGSSGWGVSLYRAGAYLDINPPSWNYAGVNGLCGINDYGVAACDGSIGGNWSLFIYDNGAFTVFTPPSSAYVSAMGINNSGAAVGTAWDGAGNAKGFLYVPILAP